MNTEALTDSQYDTADAITEWLEAHPGYHSPSRIARGVKVETVEAAAILRWMAENVMVDADGNGAWRKYSNRNYVGRRDA